MATYFVWSGAGGSNTGGSWTDAFVSLASAVSAATTDGDIIKVQYTHQENLAATVTYTFAANIVIVCVDKDSSDAATPMGTGGWIGDATTNSRSISFAGAYSVLMYGLTLRIPNAGVTSVINLGGPTGSDYAYEDCKFWSDQTVTAAPTRYVTIGSGDIKANVALIGCSFRFADSRASVKLSCRVSFYACSLDAAGTAPSVMFEFISADPGNTRFAMDGCDWSYLGSNPLVGNVTSMSLTLLLQRCKLGSGYVIFDTQTTIVNRGGPEAFLLDCSSGDSHGLIAYYNNMGALLSDTGTYLTAGAAGQSWKIVTSSQASYSAPFETPWIDLYNTDTAAVTPYFECLRNDGTATARNNDEVWAQFSAKVTAGTVLSTRYSDRAAQLSSPAAQAAGVGTGSWTIASSNSPASFKCDSGASLTPAENGHIRARVCVGAPSITVFVDPQIRT